MGASQCLKAHAERGGQPTPFGRAVMVAKIATGEIEDKTDPPLSSAAAEMGRKGGKKRAANMTPERRKEIAKAAAAKMV